MEVLETVKLAVVVIVAAIVVWCFLYVSFIQYVMSTIKPSPSVIVSRYQYLLASNKLWYEWEEYDNGIKSITELHKFWAARRMLEGYRTIFNRYREEKLKALEEQR